ncbi:uncharacterized beta-barrel protein YwiB (DUF1934 family) [Bacillus pakistanensis]|uniref:Uncharacterized beta-barrel protein YwiB (DUF1934 family) n=1 Tax=Rossellomorea pakistanensis TaxID=992288 RepID=A0ABS2NBI1_9BACI|nr:DUF1934 domain-containing protein [Bacillus pakistanensis]MBM7585215.1 uncharacterized beta-barrel protein YwiB (DUF1934 family) [Bacillus pakistanensis]
MAVHSSEKQIPVKIHLRTDIQHGDEKDSFELFAFGRYYKKGDTAYLKYDEVQEEGTVHTIIKMASENALILRSGAVKMRLSFNKAHELNGSYETEIGTLLLTTTTNKLTYEEYEENNSGEFQVHYELHMQGSSVGKYYMVISFKEETQEL